jgi:transposase
MRGSKPVKIREILRLRSLGMSNKQIARSCNCSRTTVIEMLKRADDAGLVWPEAEAMDDRLLKQRIYPGAEESTVKKPDPDFEYMNRELRRSGVNMALLWNEYRLENPEGLQYSQYCERYRQWCRKNSVTMHIQHKPGEKLFVDWAGDTMEVVNRLTGEKNKVYLFVCALGVSGYPYAEAFFNMSMASWIAAHVHAFEYYGGTPRILVPDNLRTGVEKAHNYDPVENRSYREMAEHYSTAIVPARIRRPKDKAKAENAVGDVETWVMAALSRSSMRLFWSG